MTKPLYIFDLDGTIAVKPRRPAWDEAKLADLSEDLPNHAIVNLIKTLTPLADVYVWTKRPECLREQTEVWLKKHGIQCQLKMRPDDCPATNHEIRRSWIKTLSLEDRARTRAAFESNKRHSWMWVCKGVPCVLVA